jgi:hypothetical protein
MWGGQVLKRRSIARSLLPLLAAALVGCGSGGASPSAAGPAGSPQPSAAQATPSALPSATLIADATSGTASGGAMQVRITNFADGASVPATRDSKGRLLVVVQIEVTGVAPVALTMTAGGFPMVDEGGRTIDLPDKDGALPYRVDLPWSPPLGGGDYDLIVTAMDDQKNFATATAHVTVTGAPRVTPPPAPTEAQARAKMTKLIQDQYKVTIPKPSLQRFDFPTNPTRSRWIGSAYYKGMRYYAQMFDNGTVDWSNGPFADPLHRSSEVYLCRPLGNFKVLVVFVDYGNTGVAQGDAMTQIPVVVDWLNGMYLKFAQSHGFSTAPMHVTADGAWISAPPVVNGLLTAPQIKTLAGKDTAGYDFVMQIDLDVNGGGGGHESPRIMNPGGGFALNGCGADAKLGIVNVWSSVPAATGVLGGLEMDFDHELSHLFGMMDDWPFTQGVAGPAGTTIDDWIPYVMFGWTDTDGDGIREIEDSTPYGTAGPRP